MEYKDEIWKDIFGFDGYEVSNYGRVRSYHIRGGDLSSTRIGTHPRMLTTRMLSNRRRVVVEIYKDGKKYSFGVHRLVYELFVGPIGDGLVVDHIDHDVTNNIVSNLRLATSQQNSFNRRKGIKNTTGFKGVTFNKSVGKYTAGIMIDKKRVHLGYFSTAEEASKRYAIEAEKLFGSFMYVN